MMITKQFDKVSFELKEGSREVIVAISTDAVDRDGEVVLPKGLLKKPYGGNPVVLVNHNHDSLPVGKTLWIKNDGNKVIAKAYISDKTQFANDVFGLLQDGILQAASIGFMSVEQSPPTPKEIQQRPELTNARNIIRKWELLEWSLVTIPANPEALSLAVSKGYNPDTVKFLNGGELPATADLVTPDCWKWEAKGVEQEQAEAEPLPLPAVSLCWNDALRKLDRLSVAGAIERYRGRI